MKLKRLVMFLFILTPLLFMMGCGIDKNYDGKVKVVFNLEGGKYQNCTLPVTQYYPFEEGTENLILELTEVTKQPLERSGYVFKGWYREKIVDGDKVTYEGKWDFKTDKVTSEGIELYAYWKPNVTYSYNVCYYDENGEVKKLGSYEVNQGEEFDDYQNLTKKRFGYTPVGLKDEKGNPWDIHFKHPGGDADLAINVFVEYIKGNYEIVRTAKDLKSSKSKNIYLMNDIDLEGESFSFGSYNKHFKGNGHTISNFTINYDAAKSGLVEDFEQTGKMSLAISLFGNVKDAIIEDVHFKDVRVDVKTKLSTTFKIYVSPLATTSVNSTIKNVTFDGSYSYSELPKGFPLENLIYIADKPAYKVDETTKIENVSVSVKVN